MAIAFDAVSQANINNPSDAQINMSHTLGVVSGSNRIVIIGIGCENSGNVVTCTYNGVSCTFLNRGIRGGNQVELWYILDADLPAAGGTYTVNVVWTTGGSGTCGMVGVQSFSGVEQNAPEVATTNNAGTYQITTSITTITADAWVVDAVNGSDMGTFLASGTDQTERWDRTAATTSTSAGSTRGPIASTGSISFTWAHSDTTMSRICHALCSIAPVAGSSSSSCRSSSSSSRSSSSSSSSSRSSSSSSCSSSSCSSSSSSSSRSSSSSSSSSIASSSSSSSSRSSSSSSCRSSSSSSSRSSSSSSSSGSFGATGGRQVIFSGSTYDVGNFTKYNDLMGALSNDSAISAWAPIISEHFAVMPTAGTFRRLCLNTTGSPGSGNAYTLTLLRNHVSTALAVSVTGSQTTAINDTDIVSYNAGDLIAIRFDPTGSPPQAFDQRWAVEFNSVEVDESIILGSLHTESSRTPATQYTALIGGDTWDNTEENKVFVVPKAGFLKKLAAQMIDGNTDLPAGPGTGAFKTFTVMKNGVATTLETILTGTLAWDVNNTIVIPVDAGDLISLRLVHSGNGSGNREARWGCVYVPAVAGEFIVPHQGFAPSTTVTDYQGIEASDVTWVTNPVDRVLNSFGTSFKRMYVKLENAPGNGKSRRFILRNHTQGVDTALDVTISDLNTIGVVEANVSCSTNDLLVYKHIPSGTPDAGRAQIGLVGFFVATSSSSSSCSSSSSSRSSSSSSRSSSSCSSSSSSSSSRCSSSSSSSSCKSSSSSSSSSSSRSSSSCSSSSSSRSSSSSSSGLLLSSSSSRSSSSSSSSSAKTQDTNSGWTDRIENTSES